MLDIQSCKDHVRAFYAALDAAGAAGAAGAEGAAGVMERFCAPDLLWQGVHPFDDIVGAREVAVRFWTPLMRALRPMQRRLDIFMAGRNVLDPDDEGAIWVASMGHLMGLFDAPWLAIRPTGRIAMLRYAAFHRVAATAAGPRITCTAMYFDIPHLMAQAGQNPFPPQTGAQLVQPGPRTHDGLMFGPTDPEEGKRTLAAIDAMIADISAWTGGSIEGLVEELRRTWHEDMIWWGPTGIGATCTIERYARQHAGPFRMAFRDRRFNGHRCKIAEGAFDGFYGRPNLTLTHAGGFMGMPATNTPADMRVIDIYRREGDKLAENWVFIDLLHFWAMQGLDVLGRMAELAPPAVPAEPAEPRAPRQATTG